MINFFKELKERWAGESPIFWQKILKFAIYLGTISISLIGLNKMLGLETIGVPSFIFTIAGYIVTGCTVLGLSAKITKQ